MEMSEFPRKNSGNDHHTLPFADQGYAPPLTSQPYSLSRQFIHLCSKRELEDTLKQRVNRLEYALPHLGECQQRQTRADIAYIRAILDHESPEVAHHRAVDVWASEH